MIMMLWIWLLGAPIVLALLSLAVGRGDVRDRDHDRRVVPDPTVRAGL